MFTSNDAGIVAAVSILNVHLEDLVEQVRVYDGFADRAYNDIAGQEKPDSEKVLAMEKRLVGYESILKKLNEQSTALSAMETPVQLWHSSRHVICLGQVCHSFNLVNSTLPDFRQ